MGIFFAFDDNLVNFEDPTSMVKDECHRRFARKELASFILSEMCALDMMLYAITTMNGGYHADKLKPERRLVR